MDVDHIVRVKLGVQIMHKSLLVGCVPSTGSALSLQQRFSKYEPAEAAEQQEQRLSKRTIKKSM